MSHMGSGNGAFGGARVLTRSNHSNLVASAIFVTARQAQGDQGRGRGGGTEGEEDSYENRLRSLSAH